MRDMTLQEQIQNVSYALNSLLLYVCLFLAALSSYYKMLSSWKAIAIAVPAFAIYLFGTRSLRKASAALVKGSAA
jgi:hypothetical protein